MINKYEVRFANAAGHISTVGMNNLLIIQDGRIRDLEGVKRAIERLVRKCRASLIGHHYVVTPWLSDKVLFADTVN